MELGKKTDDQRIQIKGKFSKLLWHYKEKVFPLLDIVKANKQKIKEQKSKIEKGIATLKEF